jgi:hypothetical protein
MRDDALDAALNAVAAAMTAAAPPAALRRRIRDRIVARPSTPLLHRWSPALAMIALLVSVAWLWSRPGQIAPAPPTAARPAAASAPAAAAVPPDERAEIGTPARDERAVLPRGGRRRGRSDAAGGVEPAAPDVASELVPVLLVQQLTVDSLQPARLALDAVPIPMPLTIDRVDLPPLSLR